MLVLRRTEGQWVEIVHAASGAVLRVRVYAILTEPDRPAQCHLAFDDDARNFEIQRPERAVRPRSEPGPCSR